jgi:hypothetical protein
LSECFGGKLITLGTQTGISDFSFIFAQDHLPAVEDAFGANVDYAMLIKTYQEPQDSDKQYSPGEIVNAPPIPVTGNPKAQLISTSHCFGTPILALPA